MAIQNRYEFVLPAKAGMILCGSALEAVGLGIPRASGGDPLLF